MGGSASGYFNGSAPMELYRFRERGQRKKRLPAFGCRFCPRIHDSNDYRYNCGYQYGDALQQDTNGSSTLQLILYHTIKDCLRDESKIVCVTNPIAVVFYCI
jgi:hypothetical protein